MPNGKILPDDIRSAMDTARRSWASSGVTRSSLRRYLAFYLSMYAVGAAASSYAQALGVLSSSSGDIWRTALTALAVLTGFMITTMLFTGKVESAKSLTLEQLAAFTRKSNHLLLSEFVTLVIHVSGVVMILFITAIDRQPSLVWLSSGAVTLTGGMLLLSLLRCILVPLHIIELHRFTHEALLQEKRQEIAREVERFGKP